MPQPAPVTLELKEKLMCTPQKYSRVSAPAPGPVNACARLCLNHSLLHISPSQCDLNFSVCFLVIILVSFTM